MNIARHPRLGRRFRALVPLLALTLAACGGGGESGSPPADDEAMAFPTSASGVPPGEEAEEAARSDGFASEDESGAIPVALRGRWGLVAADCTGEPAIAKGLLVIDLNDLKFYESRAVLDETKSRDERAIRAVFAFSGEGQEWRREMALRLTPDGSGMIREDFGADGAPDLLEYMKCNETR